MTNNQNNGKRKRRYKIEVVKPDVDLPYRSLLLQHKHGGLIRTALEILRKDTRFNEKVNEVYRGCKLFGDFTDNNITNEQNRLILNFICRFEFDETKVLGYTGMNVTKHIYSGNNTSMFRCDLTPTNDKRSKNIVLKIGPQQLMEEEMKLNAELKETNHELKYHLFDMPEYMYYTEFKNGHASTQAVIIINNDAKPLNVYPLKDRSLNWMKCLMHGIFRAVYMLHRAGFVFCDISPESIGITTEGNVILFGFAAMIETSFTNKCDSDRQFLVRSDNYNNSHIKNNGLKSDMFGVNAVIYDTLSRYSRDKHKERDKLEIARYMNIIADCGHYILNSTPDMPVKTIYDYMRSNDILKFNETEPPKCLGN
jgi:serine/threonine protein kinase